MSIRTLIIIVAIPILAIGLAACSSPNPQPLGLTPIPTLAAGAEPTLVPVLQVASSATRSAPVTSTLADAALGAPIFLKNCSPCHGAQGEGVVGPALRNSQYIQTAGDQAVFQTIAEGRPGTKMPAWLQMNGGPLDETQITAVIAYLHRLQNVAPLPTETPSPPEPTGTPLPPNAPTPAPAQPSISGQPGTAASMTGSADGGKALFGKYCAACHGPEGVQGVSNPDSDDGTVPTLNPIDPTIANADPKVFAANIDRFIEHGSVPSGPSPLIMMPAFGDGHLLTNQQIADIIAYLIALNQAR